MKNIRSISSNLNKACAPRLWEQSESQKESALNGRYVCVCVSVALSGVKIIKTKARRGNDGPVVVCCVGRKLVVATVT